MSAGLARAGPMSTTWSAARIASASCSTTITELPRSAQALQRLDQARIVALVQADRGPSSTYMTPVRPEPIWLASRMRCASPPDSVSAERSSAR